MESHRPILLLTRPEAQSRRFSDAFRDRFGADWPVIVSPLTEIRFLDPGPLPDDGRDLVFTSENAVAAFARLTPGGRGRAWCVGTRTEAAARAAGFSTRAGPGDAEGLARAIATSGEAARLLWPRPVHVARDMAKSLNSAGIDTVSVLIYDQISCPATDAATTALRETTPVLLPLFSPRSARLAAAAIAGTAAPLWVAAMSPAIAEAAAALSPQGLHTAETPDAAAMLDALDALIAAAKTG
ncbi:uroporphyrinogen-III synthase [Defluviimonas salinarum]|uniref:Uroporphyrinogen-III synthase n=1 Tax=Defluviimonas salinarum TaxID=2992147 RepID=A0ABT3J1G7_9RHOB|nr:uroporphyrinogen-III synthase [Defluviimonas salinarum]MCW3781529.1 uroporphyrinogen-III synthase [Defluviimonas salinarum]